MHPSFGSLLLAVFGICHGTVLHLGCRSLNAFTGPCDGRIWAALNEMNEDWRWYKRSKTFRGIFEGFQRQKLQPLWRIWLLYHIPIRGLVMNCWAKFRRWLLANAFIMIASLSLRVGVAWNIVLLFLKHGLLCTGLQGQMTFLLKRYSNYFRGECKTEECVFITSPNDGDFGASMEAESIGFEVYKVRKNVLNCFPTVLSYCCDIPKGGTCCLRSIIIPWRDPVWGVQHLYPKCATFRSTITDSQCILCLLEEEHSIDGKSW